MQTLREGTDPSTLSKMLPNKIPLSVTLLNRLPRVEYRKVA